jgi:hypothetical protein
MEKDEKDEKKRPLSGEIVPSSPASKRPRLYDYGYNDILATLRDVMTTTTATPGPMIPLPPSWNLAEAAAPAKLDINDYKIDPRTDGPWLATLPSAIQWLKEKISTKYDSRTALAFNRTQSKANNTTALRRVLATTFLSITSEQRSLLSPLAQVRLDLIQANIQLVNRMIDQIVHLVHGRQPKGNDTTLILVFPYQDVPLIDADMDHAVIQSLISVYYHRLEFLSDTLKRIRSGSAFVWYTDRSFVSEESLRELLVACDADTSRKRIDVVPLTDFWLDASFEDPYSNVLRLLWKILSLGDFKRKMEVVALPGYTTQAMVEKAKKTIKGIGRWFQEVETSGLVFPTLGDLDKRNDSALLRGEEFLVGSQGSLGLVDSISGSDDKAAQVEQSMIGLFRPTVTQSLIDLKMEVTDPAERKRLENLEAIADLFASEAFYDASI